MAESRFEQLTPDGGFKGERAFLSNFHPSPIQYEGITYPTVEHAFQAAKVLDGDERVKIAEARTPGVAKRMGRKVQLREGWDDMRLFVMRDLLRLKFADPDLAEQLLATGDEVLIEWNAWRDTWWGCTPDGKGSNYLGKILMRVRSELRDAAESGSS